MDFVITWVDGSDPVWQEDMAKYKATCETASGGLLGDRCSQDARDERYRDYDLLRFWFRGVEKYAPWVRKIHFVTYGHVPQWLDTDHPKLHIVRHDSFIPQEYLPTFNSNAIEIFLHRIQGLSDQFVYFNDDMFPVAPIQESDFFRNGLPCDMLAFQPVVANPDNPVMSHLFLNNALVISKYFDKRTEVRKHPGYYCKIGYPPLYFFYNLLELMFPRYTAFYTVHGPFPFLKSTFAELWEREESELRATASHRFRSKDDLSLYLFRDWQKLSGNFCPRNVQRDLGYYDLKQDNRMLYNQICCPKHKFLCINDANVSIDFERIKKELAEVFIKRFPEKSTFEK